VILPQAPADPLETLLALRRLVTGAPDGGGDARAPSPTDAPRASAEGAGLGAAFGELLARHGRAVARLVLPLLLGQTSGIEARMPYDLEIR
jgi:hypothetical protein